MEAANSWLRSTVNSMYLPNFFSPRSEPQIPSPTTVQQNEADTQATALRASYRTLVSLLATHRDELSHIVKWHVSMTDRQKKPMEGTLDRMKSDLTTAQSLINASNVCQHDYLVIVVNRLTQVKAGFQAIHNTLDVNESENTYDSKRVQVALTQLRRKDARYMFIEQIAACPRMTKLWTSLSTELTMTLLVRTKATQKAKQDAIKTSQGLLMEEHCSSCTRPIEQYTDEHTTANSNTPIPMPVISVCCDRPCHSYCVRERVGQEHPGCPRCQAEWKDGILAHMINALARSVEDSTKSLEAGMENQCGISR
ncbi:hypothetical protein H2200_002487 [Cladophialophora chaetospira]|uniref:Uncharacterized protein n=1 Tax=Cladophialophora chaetospira TaxID=386627 RepID=A0AA38XJW8_9EURO|nr:hypothetical protein H2200_002487 [Cladophialophora chaetospira]